MALPRSTYRLQVRAEFDLHAAADVCDYLATLGVHAAYLSPLLPSAHGSDHGYDVVRFDTVDEARGGVDGWTRLLAAARSRALRVVVDIVPNHTGVADAAENRAWWDLLRLGRDSPRASWFDIDWDAGGGRVRLPVLGDAFEPTELAVHGEGDTAELRYYEHRFPIAPGTGPAGDDTGADVHDRQHYELVNFRRADIEQNYRRFFAVTTLAGLRVEDEPVFDATHEQIRRWMQADGVDGLRIDHPDGLADPLGYLRRLRRLAGREAWIVIEKILEPGEDLPSGWPVAGTTGYDALAEVGPLFVDPAAEPAFTALYQEMTGDDADIHEHIRRGKRQAASTILRAELLRLGRLVPSVADAVEALTELVVLFPVYRSYLPVGAANLAQALEAARAARPDLAAAFDALAPRLADPADELAVRFQQTTGAVMAKGVEDTAYYRYTRFVALNEVGGDPGRFGAEPGWFHDRQRARAHSAPRGMTTLSTHDTKRGEDVRARLAVLSELPEVWASTVRAVTAAAPIPDASFAYLLWQTFAGVGFVERERMHAYAEKAMREAAVSTNWIDPDEAFEASVHSAVDAGYDDPVVHGALAALIEQITPHGWANSLSQKAVQLTVPGIPDVYQGTELWEDSLVDPDNRRAVDFGARLRLLESLDAAFSAGEAPPPVDATGAAKLWLTSRVLRLRRDWPDLFGGYAPLTVTGAADEHAVAFERTGAITVATRLPVGLAARGGWGDTAVDLAGAATDVLTGHRHAGSVPLAELLGHYPVAVLVR